MASRSALQRRRGGMSLWLRRNAWLVAAVTLVLLYCVFMVRTTMWARAFGELREQQEHNELVGDGTAMKEAMAVLREMGALKGEDVQEQAEEQAEEAAEDGREQLGGDGEQEAVGEDEVHNAHPAATTGPRLRMEEQDTVAYDDKIPLEDAGDVPMVGATEVDVEAPATTEDHKWTAFDALPLAGDGKEQGGKAAVPRGTETTENKGPPPLTASVAKAANGTHLWTGMDKLPVAGEGTSQKVVAMPGAIKTTDTGSGTVPEPTRVDPGQPLAVKSRRFDASRLVLESPQQSNASIPFENRHQTIVGYNATMAYLQLYRKPVDSKQELFLFFTCSDSKGGRDDWNPNCAEARDQVYATFAKSPSTNRLVTIYAGPRDDWRGGNAFTDDGDIRLKALPTIMRWDGGAPGALRSTWGVLVDGSILYEPLLRYLFRNADEQDSLLAQPEVETKEITTLRGYAQYRSYMEAYARNGTPHPLFMMMVSGRFERNNRLWCPWCRQSEMPVEYAFYAYAPAKAKLVLVETYDKYSEWRNPDNEFKQDPQLAMKGVPWFYRVFPGPPGEPITYQRVKKKFYVLEALQWIFEDSGEK